MKQGDQGSRKTGRVARNDASPFDVHVLRMVATGRVGHAGHSVLFATLEDPLTPAFW